MKKQKMNVANNKEMTQLLASIKRLASDPKSSKGMFIVVEYDKHDEVVTGISCVRNISGRQIMSIVTTVVNSL